MEMRNIDSYPPPMLAKCPDFTLLHCQDAIFVLALSQLDPIPIHPEGNTVARPQNHFGYKPLS